MLSPSIIPNVYSHYLVHILPSGLMARPKVEHYFKARSLRAANQLRLRSIAHAPTIPVSVKHYSFFAGTISLGSAFKSAKVFEF
jgi:hypothetical protein